MRRKRSIVLISFASFAFAVSVQGATWNDVKTTAFEKTAIDAVYAVDWIEPLADHVFGYAKPISRPDWLRALMFLRTADACPEFGRQPNAFWSEENIRGCLSGAGVPLDDGVGELRRDVAMQQLFALRRRSFAFQALETEPPGYVAPPDLKSAAENRRGALVAADRLKLIYRRSGKIAPADIFLREDAALALYRFDQWEKQGGVDGETKSDIKLHKDVTLSHWKDLDTDIYVVSVKTQGDAFVRPILPRESFNPAADPKKEKLRDEFVYEKTSALAERDRALAAVNGSYFNLEWPWGALEDTAVLDGATLLERSDRSTFIVCKNGRMLIGKYDKKKLKQLACVPEQALGAGPLFLDQGAAVVKNNKEGFDEYTQWERRVGSNARTAVAVSKNGRTAYLVTVAGKSYPAFGKGGTSLGAFLKSKYPDIQTAMMLDGGGSTALVAQDKTLVAAGKAGSTGERAVVSALGVFSRKIDKSRLAEEAKLTAAAWTKSLLKLDFYAPTSTATWVSGSSAKLRLAVASNLEDTTRAAKYTRLTTNANGKFVLARKDATHEQGWKIPLSFDLLNADEKNDLMEKLERVPTKYALDLKTLNVALFGKNYLILKDAADKYLAYGLKSKKFSPVEFKTPPKKAVKRK